MQLHKHIPIYTCVCMRVYINTHICMHVCSYAYMFLAEGSHTVYNDIHNISYRFLHISVYRATWLFYGKHIFYRLDVQFIRSLHSTPLMNVKLVSDF